MVILLYMHIAAQFTGIEGKQTLTHMQTHAPTHSYTHTHTHQNSFLLLARSQLLPTKRDSTFLLFLSACLSIAALLSCLSPLRPAASFAISGYTHTYADTHTQRDPFSSPLSFAHPLQAPCPDTGSMNWASRPRQSRANTLKA